MVCQTTPKQTIIEEWEKLGGNTNTYKIIIGKRQI